MATQILRPQDCLQNRFCREALTLSTSPVRLRRNPNPNQCACQSRRRKRSPVALQANQDDRDRSPECDRPMVQKAPAANLVMGQVKILKRGEKLSSENGRPAVVASRESPKVEDKSEDRLGPNPETVWDLKDKIYAGFAFAASPPPPPSSVPVPRFLGKMQPLV